MLKSQDGSDIVLRQVSYISRIYTNQEIKVTTESGEDATKPFTFFVGATSREFYFSFETMGEAEKERANVVKRVERFNDKT